MTTGTAPERNWQRRWAAEQLDVAATATLPEVRAAFLRRLDESEFVPPPLWAGALAILEGQQAPAAEHEALRDEQERLRGQVEAFAERFWTFPVAERWQRWEQLRSACATAPALVARLNDLKCGLDISLATPSRPELAAVVNRIKELFVLRPTERPARRRELLRREANDPSWWRAAEVIRKRYPELAELEPRLLPERRTNLAQRRARVLKALFRRRWLPPVPEEWDSWSEFLPGLVLVYAIVGAVGGALLAELFGAGQHALDAMVISAPVSALISVPCTIAWHRKGKLGKDPLLFDLMFTVPLTATMAAYVGLMVTAAIGLYAGALIGGATGGLLLLRPPKKKRSLLSRAIISFLAAAAVGAVGLALRQQGLPETPFPAILGAVLGAGIAAAPVLIILGAVIAWQIFLTLATWFRK